MSNFNISNSLSAVRIFILPFIFYFLSKDDGTLTVMILAFLAAVTDFFDGYFARKLNQVTELGKILDPLADKLCMIIVGAGIVLYRDFPLWALAVIIGRDIVIVIFAVFVRKKHKIVVVSNMLGKITVSMLTLMVFFYILRIDMVKEYLVYISMALVWFSLFSYYKTNLLPYLKKA